MPETALRLGGLVQLFHAGTGNEVRALDGVDLELARGTFTVVLGSNGSGKSTLLSAVAGSQKLTAGRVELDGRDISRWPEQRRAGLIGRVFQNPFMGTAPDLTVAENLMLASLRGRRHGLGRALKAEKRKMVRDRVAKLGMGLEDRMETPIGWLSGGQRQALTVLMATMVKPSLLLLDEHTAALDPRSAEQVLKLTNDVIVADNLTTLMVTHSMTQAVALAERILVMHRGRIVSDMSTEGGRLIKEDDLLQVFDELRWSDRLDAGAAEMLRHNYV
ncbi:MAG TPA: ATP-binding cassette domain-containing protein [Gemmatimonadales bacterium]|nr:ATP-binding cassette domain-containing protein [Gemmatimonadales bacterium]